MAYTGNVTLDLTETLTAIYALEVYEAKIADDLERMRTGATLTTAPSLHHTYNFELNEKELVRIRALLAKLRNQLPSKSPIVKMLTSLLPNQQTR